MARQGLPAVAWRARRSAPTTILLVCVAAALISCGCVGRLPASMAVAHGHVGMQQEQDGLGAALAAAAAERSGTWAIMVVAVCILLAREEPAGSPAPSVPIEKRADFWSVCTMTAVLCTVSGMINAVAIITMTGTVAHQTGDMSHFGRLSGVDGARFGMLLLAFMGGAAVSGYRKADGDALFEGRYCPCLMAAAVATVAGVGLQVATGQGTWVTLPLWAFAQGMQNGVTSKFSSMPMRTTHHTGTLTDAGSNMGLWLRARLRGEPLPPMRKTLLLVVCMVSYIAGGVAAKVGTGLCGVSAALLPAWVMAALALGLLPIAAPAPQGLRAKAV